MRSGFLLLALCTCGGEPAPGPAEADTGIPTGPDSGTAPTGTEATEDSGTTATPPGADPCVDVVFDTPDSDDGGDCNGNGQADDVDVSTGASLDCDVDGVPDECQWLSGGCTVMGDSDWFEYRAGTLPVVLSAPHGGSLMPDELETRPDASTGGDLNTQETVGAISDALLSATGQRPHVVLMHLHRHKVEANAWSLEEGTAGQPEAEAAWLGYHALIDAARAAITQHHGRGLYIDIHGLSSSYTESELGYLIDGDAMDVEDARLDHPGYAALSSLRAAEEWDHASGAAPRFSSVLRGPQSMGGLLEAHGLAVVPSPAFPWPTDDHGAARDYFDGGYSTHAHGSRLGGTISGLQIECTWDAIRESEEDRAAFAAALTQSVETWLETWLDLSLAGRSVVSFAQPEVHVWEAGAPQIVEVIRRGDLDGSLIVALDGEVNGLSVPSEVVFAAGEARADLVLTPSDDAESEGLEVHTLRIVRAADVNRGSMDRLEIVVHDDEAPTVWLDAETAMEGGPLTAELRRDHCIEPVDVAVTWGGESVTDFTWDGPDAARPLAIEIGGDGEVTGAWTEVLAVTAQPIDAEDALEITVRDADLDPELLLWATAAVDRTAQGRDLRLLPTAETGPAASDAGLALDGEDDAALLSDLPVSVDGGWTIGFRFRAEPAGAGQYRYLLSHAPYWWSQALNVYLTSGGTLRTALAGADEEYDVDALDVAGDFHDGAWHDYAVTVAPGGGASVYVDGAVEATADRGAGGIWREGLQTLLGARHDLTGGVHFMGDLAELRIYRRALTADEIASL